MSENAANAIQSPLNGNYFLELGIESLRCFGNEPQVLKLERKGGSGPAQWTVILGNNGSGKTTLLQSMAAFAANESWLPYGYWRLYERSESLKPIGSTSASILRVKIVEGIRLNSKEKGNVQNASITLQTSLPPEANRDHLSPRPTCFGYGAWRRTGGMSFGGDEYGSGSGSGEPEDDGVANLYDEGHALRNAENWLLQLDYGALKPSEVQLAQSIRLDQVKQLLVRLLPGVHEVRINPPSAEFRSPSVNFRTDDGWIPLEWAGYGYRSTVAWVIDLASRMIDRYPNSADPLSEPAVVFVDEIDLHLHPLWQRQLMDHLTNCFPNAQFVVTAHSPLFVQAATGANLVVLRRDKATNRVIIDNEVDQIANWRIDQILTSDLFGLPTARPPQIEREMQLRKQLLGKSYLDEQDRVALNRINEKIGNLPTGESADDARLRILIDRTLDVLGAMGKQVKQ